MGYNRKVDGPSGWGALTPFKLVLVQTWLHLIFQSAPTVQGAYKRGYQRTVVHDLTAGNGDSSFGDWFRGSIWAEALRQTIRQAATGAVPLVVHGYERNLKAFDSLTTATAKALARRQEVTRTSKTEWKAVNLEVRLHRQDSQTVDLRDHGPGDVVIVIIDGNTIDVSAQVANQDELVGMVTRGATVFLFVSMMTQERVRKLSFEEGRIRWDTLFKTMHLVARPTDGVQETFYVVHRNKNLWRWAMTTLPEWGPQIIQGAEATSQSMNVVSKDGGNREGHLDLDYVSYPMNRKSVEELRRQAIITQRDREAIITRESKDRATVIKAHRTMGHQTRGSNGK
jgi:hypothetical protein